MIKLGTFALILALFSPAHAEEILIPKMILTDKPSRRVFNISQVVRAGAKMPEDIRVHVRELTATRSIDISKHMKFNKMESGFDLTYFYVQLATDWYLVVPPPEESMTYPQLLRSLAFFNTAFDGKIPGGEGNGFSPMIPYLINKATGQMRNLTRQEPSSYNVKPFAGSGLFITETVKNPAAQKTKNSTATKKDVQTFTIVGPPLEVAGPVTVEDKPGYRLFSVPLADGTIQQYSDRPIPGMLMCEEILRKPSKFRRSP